MCVHTCVCKQGWEGREGRSRGRRRWRREKREEERKREVTALSLMSSIMSGNDGHAETSGTHHLLYAPPEKRWFLDINLTWGHSISLPKGTAGFSNLLCQMREFRDLRESFHCNVKVGVLRTPPTPCPPTIQISTSPICSREDSDWGKPAHILALVHTLERKK